MHEHPTKHNAYFIAFKIFVGWICDVGPLVTFGCGSKIRHKNSAFVSSPFWRPASLHLVIIVFFLPRFNCRFFSTDCVAILLPPTLQFQQNAAS